MSLGYCQTFVKEINLASADTRTQLDASLPSRFKFLGLTFFASRTNPTGTSGTIDQFKIFDGPDSSDPIFRFLLPTNVLPSLASNQGNYVMLDDTYIDFNQGLYVEVTNTNYSLADRPFVLTLMYM